MDPKEVKHLLSVYDPRRGPLEDPALEQALEQARQADPQTWEEERAFDRQMAQSLQSISVPPGLAAAILAKLPQEAENPFRQARPETAGRNWFHPGLLALAAVIVMGFALVFTFVSRPGGSPSGLNPALASLLIQLEDTSSNLQELYTSRDFGELASYIQSHGGLMPRNLPPAFGTDDSVACKVFDWQGNKVAMLCLQPEDTVYHLFVIDRKALPGVQDMEPRVVQTIDDHCCAAWTTEDRIYIMTAKTDETKLSQML